MAKAKSYNPLLKSYPDSEKINAVSEGAECLYVRLIAASDDAGRYYGDPDWVLAKLFTARMIRNGLVTDTLRTRIKELKEVGLITIYHVDSKPYIQLVDVHKSLRKDVAAQLVFPEPLTESVTDAGRTRNGVETDSLHQPNPTQPNPTQPTQGGDESPEVRGRFVPPTEAEVSDYATKIDATIDAEEFVSFYASKGWMVGKNKMKDWRQAVVTWKKRREAPKSPGTRFDPNARKRNPNHGKL